jgi:DNA repair protein RecO (recombination protein O)
MISKTRGIVLKTIKYSDNSLIAKVYTEEHGLRAYMVKGLNGKGASARKGAFQQLTLLEMVVYEKDRSNLQNIKEIVSLYPYRSMPYDMHKRCIAMFVNEVMYRSIHSEEADRDLFRFLYNALIILDNAEVGFENYHLLFLTQLSSFLGFAPRNNYSSASQIFDLQEGYFVKETPMHAHFLDKAMSKKLYYLISEPENINNRLVNVALRNELLLKLIDYYRLHIPVFGEIKSHQILSEVLS